MPWFYCPMVIDRYLLRRAGTLTLSRFASGCTRFGW